jgi:hypothetical protein
MTTIRIELSDTLARRAEEAGLLEPAVLEGILREELLRRRSMQELLGLADRLSEPEEDGTEEEIRAGVQKEIDQSRSERRAAREGGR